MKSAKEIVEQLRILGSPGTAKIYARHGAQGEILGVSCKNMDQLARTVEKSESLAQDLWNTNVHEARILATKVLNGCSYNEAHLETWMGETHDHILIGELGGLISRMDDGLAIAQKWMDGDGEWVRATGWVALTCMAQAGKITASVGAPFLDRIEKELPDAFSRERHNMNSALIALGGNILELHPRACEVAAKLGPVEVDHGETNCKTPAAIPYMQRMWDRHRQKAERQAAKAKAKKKKVSKTSK